MGNETETREIFDESRAKSYRQGEEAAVTHGSRKHYCGLIQTLSQSSGRKINVLDVGCGTGRYFHCLKNVQRLVGIDISPAMLEQAQNPIGKDKLDIETVELICGDLLSIDLPAQSFDLTYAIGVFGEYSPIDKALLDRLFGLLSSSGILFITAVDTHSRMEMPENRKASIARRLLKNLFPQLPNTVKAHLNKVLSSYYVTQAEAEGLMSRSQFVSHRITRYEHPSGWQGAHFHCIAYKG